MKRFVAKDYSTSGLSWLKEYIKDATENLIMEKTITGTFDLYKDTLDPVAIKINCHLLGIPIEEKDYFRVFSVTVQKSDKKNVVDLIEKFEKLYAYLYEHVTGKREHYKHGLISKFLSLRESAEPPLNNEELTAILLGSLLGGDQNVLTVMTKIFYALLYLRNLWQFISLNPIYIPAVVEELVRLTNLGDASAFPRIAISDIELSNGNIPAGSAIYPDVFLANRDPSVFPEPLIINPFRNSVRHLQFGYGMHHCMGQELARLEICSIISVVTELLPNLGLAAGKSPKDYAWDEGIILRRPKELPVQTL
jgi:cytochrome P450